MATSVTGTNEVIFTEFALMNDALDRVVPRGAHVRVDELVTAIRNSRRYGVYFQKVNRHGLSRTLSRWLRAGVFRNHVLVSGVGVCNAFDCPERKIMELDFNVPNRTMEKLQKL